MNKSIIYIISAFLVMFLIQSCLEEEELPLDVLGSEPGYFVECYLNPGELYKLSATKVQAIHEDYLLDYSIEFEVKVDTIKLLHSLYRENENRFIYNYGSALRFQPKAGETVKLRLISPELDTITGETEIPDEIEILDAFIRNDSIVYSYETCINQKHNYYMASFHYWYEDDDALQVLFSDFSHIYTKQIVTGAYQLPEDKTFLKGSLTLFRITEENYKYQLSLDNAQRANTDNLIQPTPLQGNLKNSMGIFTCFTQDTVLIHPLITP
jgi:hypothetical protein